MARKPLARGHTVAANVLEYGTGAINVDGCRIGFSSASDKASMDNAKWTVRDGVTGKPGTGGFMSSNADGVVLDGSAHTNPMGRWPANVVLDEEAAAMLDAQSGERKAGGKVKGHEPSRTGQNGIYSEWGRVENAPYQDSGGASRFFKVVAPDEKGRDSGDSMVQCDCNSQAMEANEWESTDRSHSTPQDSDIPPLRDTTDTPFGMENEDGLSWPTSLSGSVITDLSPMVSKSTMSTSTSRTTESRTCNCSIQSPTNESTADAKSETACGGNPASSVGNSSLSTLTTGTSAEKDGPFTGGADAATSERSLPINSVGAPSTRFLYTSKASRSERNAGLPPGSSSSHPTVKPIALMRWLVRMVTPPGGTVLDPFAGSGTTGVACAALGFPAVLVEQDPEYCAIIARRLDHALTERAAMTRQLEMAAD